MKDIKPHPCIRCKEAEVRRVNLCPSCYKEITAQLKQFKESLDKGRNNVLEQK